MRVQCADGLYYENPRIQETHDAAYFDDDGNAFIAVAEFERQRKQTLEQAYNVYAGRIRYVARTYGIKMRIMSLDRGKVPMGVQSMLLDSVIATINLLQPFPTPETGKFRAVKSDFTSKWSWWVERPGYEVYQLYEGVTPASSSPLARWLGLHKAEPLAVKARIRAATKLRKQQILELAGSQDLVKLTR